MSRDPIGEDGGFNLYAFVRNDPVNLIDLWGLAWLTINSRPSGKNWSPYGHAWITIKNDDGTVIDIGFYPAGVSSGVDKKGKPKNGLPNQSITFEVCQSEVDAALKKMKEFDSKTWTHWNNCVDAVSDVLDTVKIKHPNFDTWYFVGDPLNVNNWIKEENNKRKNNGVK